LWDKKEKLTDQGLIIQTLTVPSIEAVKSKPPFGEKTIPLTVLACPSRSASSDPSVEYSAIEPL
jgi:hypothetical protein